MVLLESWTRGNRRRQGEATLPLGGRSPAVEGQRCQDAVSQRSRGDGWAEARPAIDRCSEEGRAEGLATTWRCGGCEWRSWRPPGLARAAERGSAHADALAGRVALPPRRERRLGSLPDCATRLWASRAERCCELVCRSSLPRTQAAGANKRRHNGGR